MDRRQDQSIQGPRPTPLKIRKESHKIKKPPVAPQTSAPSQPVPPPRGPVIIYAVSPKVIHTSPNSFMSLVQRLTGPDPAGVEKTKMPLEEKGLDIEEVSTGPAGLMQGILSPGPAGLTRPVPDSFFSPLSDPSRVLELYQQQNGLLHQEYFNALHQHIQDGGGVGGAGGSGGGELLASPSVGAFLSPNQMLSPASVELLRRLLDHQ